MRTGFHHKGLQRLTDSKNQGAISFQQNSAVRLFYFFNLASDP